ncbi:exocyst complex component Sec10 [Purpureocillium lavendulum]|uniref:Exocyst complex component Sec10 n=1 Tax=Purpureocillium lavendulum TaxID=1247861 RepID=A0AB34G2Q1_9HYPO|nr:exocyst complex component Sec10 [Purpureocillium lavendulum]
METTDDNTNTDADINTNRDPASVNADNIYINVHRTIHNPGVPSTTPGIMAQHGDITITTTSSHRHDHDDDDDTTVRITARCLCKAHAVSASVPVAALPLEGTYCHCTSCRHLTGALHSSSVPWPRGAASLAARALDLRAYAFSPRLTILFCPACGTPMFWSEAGEPDDAGLDAFMGVLSNNGNIDADIPGAATTTATTRLFRLKSHIFVDDTRDGGAAVWMRRLLGDDDPSRAPIPCFGAARDQSPLVDPEDMAAAAAAASRARAKDTATTATPDDDDDDDNDDGIPVRCVCKGVDLVLRRGLADFSAVKDASQLPFFVDPASHKLLATFDACDSCRGAFGIDIINWTFALMKHVDFAAPSSSSSSSSSPPPAPPTSSFPRTTLELKAAASAADGDERRDPRLGTLTYYASSDDVQRYFCSRCSATVFYAVDDRPDMVDLAPGLLDAPDGARAESVLSWSLGTLGAAEDIKGGWREELGESIKKNAEDWRIKNGTPKSWLRKMKEETEAQKAAALAAQS